MKITYTFTTTIVHEYDSLEDYDATSIEELAAQQLEFVKDEPSALAEWTMSDGDISDIKVVGSL